MRKAFARAFRIAYRLPLVVLLLVFGTVLIIATFLLLFVIVYAIAGVAFVLFPISLAIMYVEAAGEKDGEPFSKKVTDYVRKIGKMLRRPNPRRVMKRYSEECQCLFDWMLDRNSWADITERASARNKP